MGEPSLYCYPPSEGCCLDLPETVTILVALIIVVQLALKLASVICYYLWYLVGIMFGMVVQDTKRPKISSSKGKKIYTCKPRPSELWSEQEVPRHRRRKASSSPSRRCLHCTLEPLKVTMNLKNEPTDYRGRRPYTDYPPYLPPHYYNYEHEIKPRLRRALSRSTSRRRSAVTRYQDTGVGSSDPVLSASGGKTSERRKTAVGTELVPRHHATGSGPDAERPGTPTRSRRPTKVYIYPVNPQTPPGSRSSSPERPRRRHHSRRGAVTGSQEEQQQRASRRRSREAEQQTSSPMTLRYHSGSTNLAHGQAQTEPPTGKPRYYWSDQVSGADWVYRPVK